MKRYKYYFLVFIQKNPASQNWQWFDFVSQFNSRCSTGFYIRTISVCSICLQFSFCNYYLYAYDYSFFLIFRSFDQIEVELYSRRSNSELNTISKVSKDRTKPNKVIYCFEVIQWENLCPAKSISMLMVDVFCLKM